MIGKRVRARWSHPNNTKPALATGSHVYAEGKVVSELEGGELVLDTGATVKPCWLVKVGS